MIEIIMPSAIAGLCTIVVAIIGWASAKDRKKAAQDRAEAQHEREKAAARAKVRAEESRLAMQLQHASCQLGTVTALAVTGQHTNGNVERALDAAASAEKEYDNFLRQTTSDNLSKI